MAPVAAPAVSRNPRRVTDFFSVMAATPGPLNLWQSTNRTCLKQIVCLGGLRIREHALGVSATLGGPGRSEPRQHRFNTIAGLWYRGQEPPRQTSRHITQQLARCLEHLVVFPAVDRPSLARPAHLADAGGSHHPPGSASLCSRVVRSVSGSLSPSNVVSRARGRSCGVSDQGLAGSSDPLRLSSLPRDGPIHDMSTSAGASPGTHSAEP